MMRRSLTVAWIVALAVMPACAATPRERPIELGPVNTGAGSLEAARRQLQGEWGLVTLETTSPSGEKVSVGATAVLTYDEYGNFTISGRLDDPTSLGATLTPLLAFKGRAVVDATKNELRLIDGTGEAAALETTAVSADRVRRYAFENDLLRMSTVDAEGRVTATATWKKRSKAGS